MVLVIAFPTPFGYTWSTNGKEGAKEWQPKENINTLTESSEFLITLFSGFAQAESESLSTIITWGQQQSMKNGKVTFQYSKLLGYRRGEDGQPEIVPEDTETVTLSELSSSSGFVPASTSISVSSNSTEFPMFVS